MRSRSCLCPPALTWCVLPADIIRVIPSKAVELAAFDIFKGLLASTNEETGKVSRPGALLTGLAGAAAGQLLDHAQEKPTSAAVLSCIGWQARLLVALLNTSACWQTRGDAECVEEQTPMRQC